MSLTIARFLRSLSRPATPGALGLALALAAVLPLPAFAQTLPAATEPADDEILRLDPFVISAAEDRGSYDAVATMAATRIRTDLKDVGSAISVVTAQFLQDTASHNTQDLLVYTTNTEVGGSGGNFAGLGSRGPLAISDQDARLAPQTNTRVRGLTAADNTRDFFLTDIAWDSFDTGRIDIQRGPNAILFGLGSPAGIVNASVNGAAFTNEGTLEFSTGSYGSHRATLDLNQVLLPRELAFRFDALDDRTNYQQEPAFNHDRRAFGALRWDPGFFNRGSAHTSLRINYERGRIDANRPHILPPGDRITPWFTQLNKAGFNPATWLSDPAATSKVEGLNNLFSAIFSNPASSDSVLSQGTGPGSVLAEVLYPAGYLPRTSSPAAEQFKVYRSNQLQDASVFDYRNHLAEGPNKREWSDHDIANFTLEQTFLDERLGLEAAYDRQHLRRAATSGSDGQPLTVDINTTRLDGSLNPNFGRVFLQTSGTDGSAYASTRDATRLTGFAELRFKDVLGDSPAAHGLGRHVFTTLWSREKADTEHYDWLGQIPDAAFTPYYNNDPLIQERRITTINYLGASLADRTTAAGAYLPGLAAVQTVHSGSMRYFDPAANAWIDLPVNVVNNADGGRAQARGALLGRDDVESEAVVWQGFFLDDLVVPMVGLRHDRDRSYALVNPPGKPDGSTDFSSPGYRLPALPSAVVSGNSTTWSIVAHSPKFIRDHLPGDTTVSLFFSHSENFQPKAGRLDPLGAPLPPPVGRTKDYGIRVSTLGGRFSLKINRYDTVVANDTVPGFGAFYFLSAAEGWGYEYARQNLEELNNYAGGYVPMQAGQTPAQAKADGVAISQAFLAPANQPPDSFFALYRLDRSQYAGFIPPTDPGLLGVAITGDTRSKGTEYEIAAQPVPGWNLTINASETNAQSHNLAKSVGNWIEQRWAVFNTPVAGTSRPAVIGDVRLFGPASTFTVLQAYHDNIWVPYLIYKLKEGANVNELRPWRFNFVSDYAFQRGWLKGAHFGAAYRWQDREVIGYPVLPTAGAADSAQAYDLAHPFLGPAETNIDLWAGYEWKFARKYTWRVQVNVRNAFAKKDLVPVAVQPDGSMAAGRIPEGTVWTVTNSISF